MYKSWKFVVSLLFSPDRRAGTGGPAEEESVSSTAWLMVQHDNNPCDGVIGHAQYGPRQYGLQELRLACYWNYAAMSCEAVHQIGCYRPNDDTISRKQRTPNPARQVHGENKTTPELNHCYHCSTGAICTLAPLLSIAKPSLRQSCRPKRKERYLQAFFSFTGTNAGVAIHLSFAWANLELPNLTSCLSWLWGSYRNLCQEGAGTLLTCRVTQRLSASQGGHLGVAMACCGI